jgi:hypothetical protein
LAGHPNHLQPTSFDMSEAQIRSGNHAYFRTGFSSNIKSLILMKDLTMTNYNSHNYHVMVTVFLSIMIRAIVPKYVKMVITWMCYFFGRIT